MKQQIKIAALGLAAIFAATALSPLAAFADASSRQKNKNTWRNVGVGSAAVAGYGLLKHNTGLAALGAAGAAYSAHRYEQDRHSQSVARSRHKRYYHRKKKK